MLERDDRPIHTVHFSNSISVYEMDNLHPDELSKDGLNPHLQKAPLTAFGCQSTSWCYRRLDICLPHVGLMKHVWVVVERKEMASVC